MNEERRNKVALFRYGVLAPLIQRQNDDKSNNEFFLNASKKSYEFIDGKMITVHQSTIRRWHGRYVNFGFDGLKPGSRSDDGVSRKLDKDIKEYIVYYLKEYPRLPATQIYEKLIENGVIGKDEISLSTITRFVSSYKKANNQKPIIERRRYEREHINEVWCGDTSYGPYINIDGDKRRVYIIALIDDASRMITGIDVFFEDNFINLMKVIKSAITKYGKPKVFNFDNGRNYRSNQMALLSARIGCGINYCHIHSPVEKAKIERWFRTLKDQWMSLIKSNDYHSLDELRLSLLNYVSDYNFRVHSSLDGKSPHDRFFEESDLIIRMNDEEIERNFLLEVERKVSPDSVVVIDEKEYEVDYHYQNQTILLRYSPDLSKIYVVDRNDKTLKEIHLLDKKANSKIKRERVKFVGDDE